MCIQRAYCNAASSESSCSQESGVFPGFAEGALADGKVVFLNLSGFTDKNKRHSMSVRTLFRGQLGKTVLRCLEEILAAFDAIYSKSPQKF